MFLRPYYRRRDGQREAYWALVGLRDRVTELERLELPAGKILPFYLKGTDKEIYDRLPRCWALCDGKKLCDHPDRNGVLSLLRWPIQAKETMPLGDVNRAGLIGDVERLKTQFEGAKSEIRALRERPITIVKQGSLTVDLAEMRMPKDQDPTTKTIPTGLTIPDGASDICFWIVPKSDIYRMPIVNELWAEAIESEVKVRIKVEASVPVNDGGKPIRIDIFVAYRVAATKIE